MAPLHALEDEIAAGLQAEMGVRHQARLAGEGIEQLLVESRGIEGGQPQPRQLRNLVEDTPHQGAEPRPRRQVGAVAGDVDTGQHDLAAAAGDQRADPADDGFRGDAAVVAAGEGDDAEGAAVVAAILDLDEGARPSREAGDRGRRALAGGRDVVDPQARRRGCKARGIELLAVAEHGIDLRHGGEGLRRELRGAAGDDDAGAGSAPAGAANRLARLSFGFRRHRAGVDDHSVGEAGGRSRPPASPRIRTR